MSYKYLLNTLRWLRVIGDTIFAVGVLALGWFVLGLKTGWSVSGQIDPDVAGRQTVASAGSET